jgi:hypothetical protein
MGHDPDGRSALIALFCTAEIALLPGRGRRRIGGYALVLEDRSHLGIGTLTAVGLHKYVGVPDAANARSCRWSVELAARFGCHIRPILIGSRRSPVLARSVSASDRITDRRRRQCAEAPSAPLTRELLHAGLSQSPPGGLPVRLTEDPLPPRKQR